MDAAARGVRRQLRLRTARAVSPGTARRATRGPVRCWGAVAVGEQSIVADAMEALGQHVHQKAPDELVGWRASWSYSESAPRSGNPSTERDAGRRRRRSAGCWRWRRGGCSATDRRARPVARRTAPWHRPPTRSCAAARGRRRRLAARRARAWSPKNARRPAWWAASELAQEQSPEQAREHPHRQEEAGPARHPARAIERDAAARHDHVHVRMMAPTPTIP